MSEFNKKQKKHLRELAGLAYEKEMNLALGGLFEEFKKWEKGKLNPLDLNEKIHQHHNYKSRDLYKIYAMGDPEMAVARWIARGLIKEEEVKENCLGSLERTIEFYKENKGLA